jgi:hypothetical protein
MIADPLQPNVVKVEGGCVVRLGEQFPICTVRTQAAANAVMTIVESIIGLPDWSPVSLVVLTGYMPGQCLDPQKNKPLRLAWGQPLTSRYLQLANLDQPAFEYGGEPLWLRLAIAGQSVNLPIGP